MRHIPMMSGGEGSYVGALRVREKFGPDDMTLLFTDVKGENPSRHAGEDIDTYRFLAEASADVFGVPLTIPPEVYAAARNELTEPEEFAAYLRLREVTTAALGPRLHWHVNSEDIWQVYRRRRRIGSGYAANCSYELKQKPARAWLEANCDPDDTVIYIGIDWMEAHRCQEQVEAYAHKISGCRRRKKCQKGRPCDVDSDPCQQHRPCTAEDPCTARLERPWRVCFPLIEWAPKIDKDQVHAVARARGLAAQRLYLARFPHGNCAGFCVRAGKAQFEMLRRLNPERYAYHAEQEELTRRHIGSDVSIHTERQRGGTTIPLTLRRFGEQLDTKTALFDEHDFGGCGSCFTAPADPEFSDGESLSDKGAA